MSENPEVHNAIQDEQIRQMSKDIKEIKDDLKTFLVGYKNTCEETKLS